jgi:hypothetical protein
MNVELINLTRSRSMEISEDIPAESNVIRMCASTRNAVQVRVMVDGEEQMWDEILEHEDASVDRSACRSLLLNHDPDNIIGTVRSITLDGMASMVEAEILPGARLATGVSVMDAVRSGALRGVSIGYRYRMDPEDLEIDAANKRLCVRKWRLLETTLTPIPADTAAGVRSLTLPVKVLDMDTPAPSAPASPVAPDVAALRAEAKQVAAMARSLTLPADEFVGLPLADAQAAMIAAVAKRDADLGGKPAAKVVSHIQVGEEHHEKAAKRAVGALLHTAGFDSRRGDMVLDDGSKLSDIQANNSLRGASMTTVLRSTLEAIGQRTGDLDNHALARIAVGKRDAANTSTGILNSFVFANFITKAVSLGHQMNTDALIHEKFVSRMVVPDYKQFVIGTLGMGNLVETVENAAFPEATKAEGSYNSQVKMFGLTVSLSEQAIASDDTGQFMKQVAQAGLMSRKTKEREVLSKLMAFSYSSPNLTTSAGIGYTTADGIHAARTNLAATNAALATKIGTDGNPLNNFGRFLVVPPVLFEQAKGLVGVAPGQQNTTNLQYEVLTSPFLSLSSLTGNSATAYYLLADPMFATGVQLSTVAGFDGPRVEQFDPGAVAALKFKIYEPFVADVVSHTYGGQTVVAGVQKATA